MQLLRGWSARRPKSGLGWRTPSFARSCPITLRPEHWLKFESWTAEALLSSRAWLPREESALWATASTAYRTYHVYIMSSLSRTLYTGVTNDLERRVFEHKEGKPGSFTARYKANRLVYGEEVTDITQAIACEKEIKSMTRRQKIKPIESMNPEWQDFEPGVRSASRRIRDGRCGRPERSEGSRRGRSSFAALRTARAASRARHARE